YDSISQACGAFTPLMPLARRAGMGMNPLVNAVLAALPPDATRASQIPTPRAPGPAGTFLDTFGRPRREVACECERSSEGSVGQALVMINGDLINRKIAYPMGRLQALLNAPGQADIAIIDDLYLATLSRHPTSAEAADAAALVRSARARRDGFQD